MLQYYFKRLGCVAMSMLLAVSIVGIIAGGLTVGLFKSEAFIQRQCEQYSEAIIADIESAGKEAAVAAGLPEDAFSGAVTDANFSTVSAEIARMFCFRYSADYSDSASIYTLFYQRLSDYDNKNSLGLTPEQEESAASLALSYMNYHLAGDDSTGVKLFNLASKNTMLYLLIASVVGLIVGIVSQEALNNGRHRKFSFIGMGFNVAGYVLVLLPLALRLSGVLSRIRFCVYGPYDDMVRLCHNTLLQYLMLAGFPMILIGMVMLLSNYRYYMNKLKRARASREDYDRIKEDFMDLPKPAKPRKEGEDLERHVMKIDFEEE